MNEKNKTPEGTTVEVVGLLDVEIGKIERGENCRKHFDPAKMKELQESVGKYGITTPILLTPHGKPGFYLLVAGERRIRAATAVDLKTVPAKVVKGDVSALQDLQLIENLQREDLNPIEEARGLKRLIKDGQADMEAVAHRVGKGAVYVSRLIRLLELPGEGIRAIEKGRLTPEHGHQLLRVPEHQREGLLKFALTEGWRGLLPTVDELRRQIEQRIERDLSKACFPKDKPVGGAIACAVCPWNSANQNVLFSNSEAGKCTNGACYSNYVASHFMWR